MTKQEAIQKLGGTPTAAARKIGITVSAISQWPEVLPPKLLDRVQAALFRMGMSAKTRKQKVA